MKRLHRNHLEIKNSQPRARHLVPSRWKSLLRWSGVAAIVAVAACVTVNVNFPESTVQQAADDYVKDLYKTKEREKAPASEGVAAEAQKQAEQESANAAKAGKKGTGASSKAVNKKKTSSLVVSPVLKVALQGLGTPSAWALEFQMNSAKIKSLRSQQASRLDELDDLRRRGVVGEGVDGLLVLKGVESLRPLEKKKIERVVEEENTNRKELYAEVIEVNQLGKEAASKVNEQFARAFQKSSPAGSWIETEKGTWKKK